MSVTIFDLDNCISDDSWRYGRIDHAAPTLFVKWHAYHLLGAFDKCMNRHAINRVKGSIVIVTSRPNYYRPMTEEWLGRNGIRFAGLVMRNMDDESPPAELKVAQVQSIQEGWKKMNGGASIPIAIAYDDDPNVIRAYDEAGIRAQRLLINEDRDYDAERIPGNFSAYGHND